MKTQISSWRDGAAQRRSGLYQQQDRMLIDSDFNELTELLKRRIDEALGDVVGSGAPRSASVGLIENGPLIRRAALYVDGLRARFASTVPGTSAFALTQQADFPSPPAYPGGDQVLYADVWELPITALQDSSLLDPGLHGMDTATRTQTLAQVKWCAGTVDPLTDPKNPAKGDALLSLAIRERTSAADPCDPCAAQIALNTRIGNYLFRVEVHDVQGAADAPTEITLKWSSENAAEQHAQASVPAEFTRGNWIYEFYSDATEKHLGVHLTPGFAPARAILKDGWPSVGNLPDPNVLPYVRRWDAYAVLVRNGAVWSIKTVADVLQAKDSGRRFQALPSGTTPAHGHYIYTAPNLIAQLSGLSLTIALDGKKFVAGDYWLATVREDAQESERVQPTSSTPLGITHHYAVLARANGATIQALSDTDIRRLSFPRLTDLTADRIGYSPTAQSANWADLLDEATAAAPPNVQSAIDVLIERLESSDFHYTVPGCGTQASPSVRSLLGLTAGGNEKLETLLTKLLCDFKATGLPIDKTAAGLPPIFNVPAIASVQQALIVLGGTQPCEITVGSGGQFATLTDAFAALSAASDISLCLLPGVQNLPSGATVTGKGTIKLTGVGAYSSKVTLGSMLQLGAKEIILRDLALVGQGAASIALQADRVVAQGSAFVRAATWSPHLWSKRFGGTSSDVGFSTAVDASGNVIITGFFNGTVNFGGTDLVSAGGLDIFIAKLSSSGSHVWSKRFGGTGTDVGVKVALDSGGKVTLAGFFSGTVNFGGGNLTSAGGTDIFVVRLDSAGNHEWSKRFGGTPDEQEMDIVVDADGNVLVTGYFSGTINFGGSDLVSAGSNDIFVAKLGVAAGAHVWSKRFGATADDRGVSVAVDVSGNVMLTGTSQGTVNFGGANLTSVGVTDVWVAKLDASGNHVWSKRFGSTGSDFVFGMAVEPNGNVVLMGTYGSTINFGGPDLAASGVQNIFLVKLDSLGNHLWSKRFGVTGANAFSLLHGITVAANGDVLMTGSFFGTLYFGGSDLISAGSSQVDIYAVKFDSSGRHLWSKRFGATSDDEGTSAVFEAGGNIVLTGYFGGTVNFGGADLVASGIADIFVAKLAPEPVIEPLVTIRPRDASHGTDLVWSQNDMLTTIAETGGAPQPRTALALATPNIGGAIVDNTIDGRLLLLSDLPSDVADPFPMAAGVTSVGGGAYLTIRGNHIARVSSRYEAGAPNLDAFGSLILTDNMVVETNNSLIAEAITLNKNQFLTQSVNDALGVAAARQMTIVGNQATHVEAQLRIVLSSFREAANALTVNRTGSPGFQTYPISPWYFGGVGADLL